MASKGVVRHSTQVTPLAAQIAANFHNEDFKWVAKKDQDTVELQLVPTGEVIQGATTIARYFARLGKLYGNDVLTATQIDMWIDWAANLKEAELTAFSEKINAHLQLRTYLVGNSVSLADITVFAALRGISKWDEFSTDAKSKTMPHILRWYCHIEALPQVTKTTSSTKTAAVVPAKAAKGKSTSGEEPKHGRAGWQGSYDLGLVDAQEGKVVTRFPPEPSGFLHVGHIKAAMLNAFYATQYKGKLILRFDDTNPAKEKDDYVESIMQDLKTLEIVPQQITYTSDYFDELQKYAEALIKAGKAYIDDTPLEQMRIERRGDNEAGVESKCRNQTIEENLAKWNAMKAGTPEGLKCVMRAKIDMKSKNGVMRDPSLYRCLTDSHYRVGNKYKVFPLYDFACPIVDSLEGVTHALRSSEYHDRNPLYEWVLEATGVRKVHMEDFSRLNFEYVLLSKRKLQWFVANKLVDGWDDARFPTVQGILRRGMTVEALREFILAQGASKSLNLMTMDKLWAINKMVIDPIVPRFTALDSKKVPFVLSNGPKEVTMKSVPRHKKNPALGMKVISQASTIFLDPSDAKDLKENEEVTLMDWGNAIIRKVTKNADGVVVELAGELHLEGDFKLTEKKLTWLPDIPDLVPVTVQTFDYLVTKNKIGKEENFKDYINNASLVETTSIGDPSLPNLNKGDKIQLERRGYFICDRPFAYPDRSIVLINIPDGKQKKDAEPKKPEAGGKGKKAAAKK